MSKNAPMLNAILLILSLFTIHLSAQSTTFTYQGSLEDGAQPANGDYDFEFRLFDQASNGSQVGPTVTANGVEVVDGVFTVALDFGDQFPGDARWLEIRVSTAAARGHNAGGLTILMPRQPIGTVPYAMRSTSSGSADTAATADNALQLGGVSAGQFVLTTDPRLSDPRNPLPGSADYVQNRTTQQPASDFNVSGTGKAGIFDAGSQFDLAGNRILGATQGDLLPVTTNIIVGRGAGSALALGDGNTFTGYQAGQFTSDGDFNTFGGFQAGRSNTTGGENTFFGARSGTSVTTSGANSFFGAFSGDFNTSGANNSFFGTSSGANNTTGATNSFFGSNSGNANTTGYSNSFFGYQAGTANTEGANNSFFGQVSGFGNTTGASNTFVGFDAGSANATGSNNTLLGSSANLDSGDLTYAAAIGSGATVDTSNTIVLGRATAEETVRIPGMFELGTLGAPGTEFLCRNGTTVGGCSGVGSFVLDSDPRLSDARTPLPGSGDYIQNGTTQQASSDFNISGTGKAATFDVTGHYSIGGNRVVAVSGVNNTFFGIAAGQNNSGGFGLSFFGKEAGFSNTSGGNNSFFGDRSGEANTTGASNSFFGWNSGLSNIDASGNTFIGSAAGQLSNGNGNTFIGSIAGDTNETGTNNTVLGAGSDVGSVGLTNATAIGFRAFVEQSNSLVLGSVSGVNLATSSTNVGIGTTAPNALLHIAFPSSQVLIGDADCNSSLFGGIGFDTTLNCTNYALIGRDTETMINVSAGGTIYFREGNSTKIRINPGGILRVDNLGSAGSTSICRNASLEISTCSSSLRYKSNIENYFSGSAIIDRLRPVTFAWKDSGVLDLGLVAEEVAEIEPLLVTYNAEGIVEGVKYDRIGVVLVNVVKEQQKTIESLRDEVKSEKDKGKDRDAELKTVKAELAALKALVCGSNPGAAVCQ